MSAFFHPKEDLLVSASLDQTVRVWDIGGLKKKTVSPVDISRLSQMSTNFFGGVDAVVKYVLKSHHRPVNFNWASFHPTLPLLVSCADNCEVKLWGMSDSNARVQWTFRDKRSNISCVLFQARHHAIIASSEDKCINVWDAQNLRGLVSLCRKHDRFWILAAHPETDLVAAGHDSGMIVFKLKRERPAFFVSGDSLVYLKDQLFRVYEFSTQKENELVVFGPLDENSLSPIPRISYTPTKNAKQAILICFDGGYKLHILPKGGRDLGIPKAIWGTGRSAVFVSRSRFVVLSTTTNKVEVKNLKNEIVKVSLLPTATDAIFYAGGKNLLCTAEDRVIIFDRRQEIVLGELQAPFIKHIVWSPDMESVALLRKQSVVIADKNLLHRCTLRETNCVKSGAWDDNGVFLYTTLTQIKYFLTNGDSGFIKTLEVPVYITKIYGNTIFCLDRDGRNCPIIIDSTEYIFKLALLRKRYDQVTSMIKNSELCGQAIISYLHQKGFPEVALCFVKDEPTHFNLALESGNIETALESARKIDRRGHWYRLGVKALLQGNAGIAEYAYQKTKNLDRLSFLYLITGNLDKLSKMMRIENEVMGQFQDALYLGDVHERVKILEKAGQLPLAYMTAAVHGLKDTTKRLAEKMGGNVPLFPKEKKASLLLPPTPILGGGDWPLLMVTNGMFEDAEGMAVFNHCSSQLLAWQ